MILADDTSAATWIKAGLKFCVPFVGANLGLRAGKGAESGAQS